MRHSTSFAGIVTYLSSSYKIVATPWSRSLHTDFADDRLRRLRPTAIGQCIGIADLCRKMKGRRFGPRHHGSMRGLPVEPSAREFAVSRGGVQWQESPSAATIVALPATPFD
jgi:hypothetical protein